MTEPAPVRCRDCQRFKPSDHQRPWNPDAMGLCQGHKWPESTPLHRAGVLKGSKTHKYWELHTQQLPPYPNAWRQCRHFRARPS